MNVFLSSFDFMNSHAPTKLFVISFYVSSETPYKRIYIAKSVQVIPEFSAPDFNAAKSIASKSFLNLSTGFDGLGAFFSSSFLSSSFAGFLAVTGLGALGSLGTTGFGSLTGFGSFGATGLCSLAGFGSF